MIIEPISLLLCLCGERRKVVLLFVCRGVSLPVLPLALISIVVAASVLLWIRPASLGNGTSNMRTEEDTFTLPFIP